ncbi:MAG: hypothetical protein JWR60_1403 [Polaromonas sp.]|nr:hypothetical protein [Polaromonas sp.]
MIYVKTELGQASLQNRSLALTPRQRSAFIMFDGKRSGNDVIQATHGLGVTADDIEHLVQHGLLKAVAGAQIPVPAPVPAEPAASLPGVAAAPTQNEQAHYSKAYPIATRLTAALGLRGFRLNLAVEAAGDLAKLKELAPKIKDAVGSDKFRELEAALYA